jgi:hypothetical protein
LDFNRLALIGKKMLNGKKKITDFNRLALIGKKMLNGKKKITD